MIPVLNQIPKGMLNVEAERAGQERPSRAQKNGPPVFFSTYLV